jgi:hypothetical protein
MSVVNIKQTTQFRIKKLDLNSKYGTIDLSAIFEEINIFDSVLNPCMSGNIVIKDAIGLAKKLVFDGSEFLDISISKDNEASTGQGTNITKTFRIFKFSDRKNINQNSEIYILHFASEELIYSEQQKVNQAYNGLYSDIATSVLKDYLKVSTDKIAIIEKTKGIHNSVVPLLSPIDSMNWLAKRSVSDNNLADFLFFENQYGFNFVSLNKLFSIKPLFAINFSPKNISDSVGNEFFGVRDYTISTAFDILENTRNGFYSNRFIGFDVLTRTLVESDLGIKNHFNGTHLNDKPNVYVSLNREGKDAGLMPFSKVALYPFQLYRNSQAYVKANDSVKSLLIDDTHKYIPQRKAILHNLLQRKMTVALPGNFAITSGFVLDVKVPAFASKPDVTDQNDKSISGKYLIVATRHVISSQKHETFCELATDSTNNGVVSATDSKLQQSKYR